LPETANFEDFAEIPFIDGLKNQEPRRTVQHARDFLEIMKGAETRYDFLLQSRFGTIELKANYEKRREKWRERA
jgi:hypothetical protein